MFQYVKFSLESGDQVAVQFDTRAKNWAEAAKSVVFELNTVSDIVGNAEIMPEAGMHQVISPENMVSWLNSCKINS